MRTENPAKSVYEHAFACTLATIGVAPEGACRGAESDARTIAKDI